MGNIFGSPSVKADPLPPPPPPQEPKVDANKEARKLASKSRRAVNADTLSLQRPRAGVNVPR